MTARDRSILGRAISLRQPVARYRLGEVRHRPGAGHHRRQEAGEGEPGALCGRRERPRVPDAARRSSARPWKAPSATRSCTRCWPRGGCSTRTTRPSPPSARGCTRSASAIRRCNCWRRRRTRCAHRQGAQMVGHARRPGLHRAVDSLRGDAAGADRSDRRAPAGGPRGDPAGDEAESGVLSKRSTPTAQREEDAEERAGGAGRDRRISGGARGRRCSQPCSSTCGKWAKRARPPKSRPTSSGTSMWKA